MYFVSEEESPFMNPKIQTITRSGILLALLLVFQGLTRGLPTLVTGSCVNFVLGMSSYLCGLGGGLAVAFLSPFFAFLFGIGPQFFGIIPFVAAGNFLFVFVLSVFGYRGIRKKKFTLRAFSVLLAAVLKFLFLYLTIVKLVLPALGLPDAKVAAMSAMFSFPQLLTALIGGGASSVLMMLLPSGLQKNTGKAVKKE